MSRDRTPGVSGKTVIAKAIMSAVEPLVELLLQFGVTSPEAESLLRGVFVHTTRNRLARQTDGGRAPSDSRVALVSGVHRNFVRRILAEPPRIAPRREEKGHRADALLRAWHSDPRYLDNSGKPRDLPERGPAPSFFTLSSKYVHGAAPGVVLEELHRAGVVQLVAERRVRVRSQSMRLHGMSTRSAHEMSVLAKELLETLSQNLQHPNASRYVEILSPVPVDESRVAAVRDLISRAGSTFVTGLGDSLAFEGRRRRARARKRARIGVAVCEIGTRVIQNQQSEK